MSFSQLERKKHAEFVELATKAAKLSVLRNRHGCVVYVPSLREHFVGWNHETMSRKGCAKTVHAEMHACMQVPRHLLQGAVMYVVRMGGHGGDKFGYSRPCAKCSKRIVTFRIGRVFYSLAEGGEYIHPC